MDLSKQERPSAEIYVSSFEPLSVDEAKDLIQDTRGVNSCRMKGDDFSQVYV